MSNEAKNHTPMMAQWHACKESAKQAILLFRMGDFYEAFHDDALLVAKEIDLTLTQRQGIPMAGIPHHTCESYIDKLVSRGFRVAVAEQMEDPKNAKGLVRREIVRIVTPGTVVNSSLLNEKANNFFASLSQIGSLYGLAFIDHTTGEFRTLECDNLRDLSNELFRLRPSEFLVSEKFLERHKQLFDELHLTYSPLINSIEDWRFDHHLAYNSLISHFKIQSLDSFGLNGMAAATNAAGALLLYLRDILSLPVDHLHRLKTYSTADYLSLDRISQRNLELVESLRDGSKKQTLLELLDQTHTPMGGRLIRQWILQPLLSLEEIALRQDAIAAFLHSPMHLSQLSRALQGVRDLERLMMKISAGYASPRDLVGLKVSLEQLPALKKALENISSKLILDEREHLKELKEVTTLIGAALVDEPPARVTDGYLFRDGYHPELDELRLISRDGKSWLARYQAELRESTGIKTLKVSFTGAFGYYIEVSKGQAANMPPSFQRRQTLVSSERFISPELKEYEQKVLTAEDRMIKLENELFTALRQQVANFAEDVWQIARSIAKIDCLQSLAEVARKWHYIRPIVDDSYQLQIIGGRHPVIEASITGKSFTANDTFLDNEAQRLILLTGPNMAGKSTYMRQVALIAILAHIGSFVPAKEARIGRLDKVFTRIGASDDLSRGQSTFMVEMTETANILHNATSRSLVILDEIGRGTSTYDGISIAWAVASHLLTCSGKQPKTLFATHYAELTELEQRIPGAVNFNVAVQEVPDGIIFLHKIVKGGTDRSYGIHVARLAGLPHSVIEQAKQTLLQLEAHSAQQEKKQIGQNTQERVKPAPKDSQMLLFTPPVDPKATLAAELLKGLKKLDLNQMTPLQALQKLAEIKTML